VLAVAAMVGDDSLAVAGDALRFGLFGLQGQGFVGWAAALGHVPLLTSYLPHTNKKAESRAPGQESIRYNNNSYPVLFLDIVLLLIYKIGYDR
jgi:hypothetical protein